MASTIEPIEVRKGLEGVIAGDTAICHVDGERCQLIYRGYNIDDLIGKVSYEEVSYLLLYASLPKRSQLSDWTDQLVMHRAIEPEVLSVLKSLPVHSDPMALLRTLISVMALYDPEEESNTVESNRRKAARTIAKTATLVAAISRLAQGHEPISPRADNSHAANFLLMLHGEPPSQEQARALDTYFVLLAEHGFNASTFTARTVSGTQSDFYSSIVAAIGSLKGPLHGAAGRKAMETLIEIGSPDQVESFVQKTLADHKRFMGFGHRVYKGDDPRGKHLKALAKGLGIETEQGRWFTIAERMQEAVFKAKGLHINVDFYSAPLLQALGIPTELFTAMFACARMAGWSAHILEQTLDNRLIRPLARYVGPRELRVVPIDQR